MAGGKVFKVVWMFLDDYKVGGEVGAGNGGGKMSD